ncbi:ABC transporter, ATP-binding protein [Pseudoramibacter alactolyticus ATCC 23263]|uniref:ABC transporter, ATP-binding protein n=1 Tax=Pseudoramibacter alactolyticus ATCC 23263 TaxID=887929 RepID=E6MFX4_9FIRM|nr:ABC transporter ATP-binding protein [Pseudoramibacter alactolyticus]EFV02009.1 ABC transporter, ATP-binding protein [Pseudoramibacter alactolyticus ATCC 23263]
MELIKRYIQKNKNQYMLAVLLAILGVTAGLFAYLLLADIIVALIGNERDGSFYLYRGIALLACLSLKEVFAVFSTSVSHKATFQSLKEIREELSAKLFHMPLGNIMNIPSGKLKNIIVDQVDSMETTMAHIIPEMTANILGPIVLFVYMLILDWRLALVSLIPLLIGMFCMKSVMATYGKNYQKSVEINQGMNNAVVEYINGIEVIKTFNQSDASYKKYSDAVYDNAAFYYGWMKETMLGVSAYRKISPMSLLTILPLGICFNMNGTLPITSFITIIILSFGTIENILTATNYMDDLARIGTITKEIGLILDSPDLEHGNSPVELQDNRIELTDVNFSYVKDKKVLDNVSLFIEENQVSAFAGESGSGKSTITKLIAGFWNPESGEVKIGGRNIKEFPLEQLADIISYVSQDNYLFALSIRENIRIGKPSASDVEVEEIAKQSGCHDFICNLPAGYDTIAGEGGGHLSGGERQRIAIARAMLKNAPIVILDEATSYMDTENESIVQEAISSLVKGKTLILIAHRLRTIVNADKIFVVDKGRIENSGSHKELLEKSKAYQSLWNAAVKEAVR